MHAKTWEVKTGGKVKIIQLPFAKLFDAFLNSMKSKNAVFDVIFYAPAWAGDFFQYLSILPDKLVDDETFDDIHPTYRDMLMKWNGKWVAITVDGDLFNGYYRKDLFENTKNKADFKKRYHYDLTPPETWKEYADIAEFFTGRTDLKGKKIFGTSEAFAKGGQQFWTVFSRASAYTNHPDHPGSQFFDPETMKAQINNPGWVRAVEEYLAILKFCPPDAKFFDIVAVRKAFTDGETAMALDWGDTGPIAASSSTGSTIKDKVGYFVLPGTLDIWDAKTKKWDKKAIPYKAPFLAFGGWVGSVPENSRHKDAAWNYIMWYANPKNSLNDVITSGTGINPYRFTHFTGIDAWTSIFSKRAASEYLGVLRASLDSPNVALDLRIPGFHQYTTVFEIQLTKALNNEITVKKALDTTAVEWEKITDKMGRKKQLEMYRSSMGL
ncbi:MAG: hypothetical protein B6I31_01270 [Desulfobacteraceae bacterium 4572_19]|nr:MAG: hypothetical protein B6I31_01270 [Desulfobacteraceae bacterium 4572_19]